MKPFYHDNLRTLYQKDCQDMSELDTGIVDLLATDPPYGISFMGKDWDRALPDIRIWKECFRVLKPGAFAFVMSIPRSDCLSRMIICLEIVGFWIDFTPIFWTYASGFPKAQNIGKAVDKRLGVEREIVGKEKVDVGMQSGSMHSGRPIQVIERDKTIATAPQVKALDGSYGGFQPKPAVEVIIVAMKPLSEKTFVDQALKNGKGITWLDDCRIPYEEGGPTGVYGTSNATCSPTFNASPTKHEFKSAVHQSGRFPANLLVSDDVLNDGRVRTSGDMKGQPAGHKFGGYEHSPYFKDGDSGSFSRFFDLDAWWAKTFPFLIVPKASKSEKNKGCEDLPLTLIDRCEPRPNETGWRQERMGKVLRHNTHPTVKPIKLMSYLITLGSREGDIILDNFGGSGTTAVAAALLGRKCVMYETRKDYCEIAVSRCSQGALEF